MTFAPHHKILLLFIISTFLLPAWAQGKDVPERIDIDERYKWDLSDMYRDTQAWEVDREKFIAALPTLERFRGQLSTDGPTLLAAIEAMQSVETIIANLYVYAGLRSYEDTRVSENAARFSEAQSLYARYQETLSFFTPELLAIPEHTLSQLLASTPGLAVYTPYLEEIARMRPYTLSEAEEKLLASKIGARDADMTGSDAQQLANTVEALKERQNIRRIMGSLQASLPEVYQALIGERDVFMTSSILKAGGQRAVAVVGMAHMDVIETALSSKGYTPAPVSVSCGL